jgi:serine/threonine protein kinase
MKFETFHSNEIPQNSEDRKEADTKKIEGDPKSENTLENTIERDTQIDILLRKEVLKAFENYEMVFLGAGNYGVVLNSVKLKGDYVCMKILWDHLEIYEGSEYSDDNDTYTQCLKNMKRHFDDIASQRNEMLSTKNIEFVPQNSPEEEYEKQNKAYLLLKESGIDCRIPEPFLHGTDSIDDTEFMDDDSQEMRSQNVYSRNEFQLIVMEKIVGKNLQDISDRPNQYNEYIELYAQNKDTFDNALAEALSHLNKKGVMHGDINLRNIMIDENGKPVIIDFGSNTAFAERSDPDDLAEVLKVFKKKTGIDK